MRLIATLTALLALLAGGLRAQEEEKKNMVLKGVLAHDPKLEGGVWTLKFEGTVYDLHGDLSKYRSGDKVVIEGRACPDRACFHMVGVVFTLTTVRIIEERAARHREPGLRWDPERSGRMSEEVGSQGPLSL